MNTEKSKTPVAIFTDESVIQNWMQYKKTGELPVQKVHVAPPECIVYLPDVFAHPEINDAFMKASWDCCVDIGRCISDCISVAYGRWAMDGEGGYKRDLGSTAFKLLELVFDTVFHEAFNSTDAPDDSGNTAFDAALRQFEEFANGVLHQLPLPSFACVYWAQCVQDAVENLRGFRWNMHLISVRLGQMDDTDGTNGRAHLVDAIACSMKADWRMAFEKRLAMDGQGPSAAMVDKAKRIERMFVDHMVKDPCPMNAMKQTLQQFAAEAV